MRFRDALMIALLCGVVVAGGVLIGRTTAPAGTPLLTELEAAQAVAGDDQVRLIGFLCGNTSATVLARETHEFPDGCKEIRVLSDKDSFPTRTE